MTEKETKNMNEQDLEYLTSKWKELKEQIERVETTIKNLVLLEKKSLHVNDVYMKYNKGKSTISWNELADSKNVPNSTVVKYEQIVKKIDWKKVCQDIGYTDEELEGFTKPGNPSVKIDIKEKKK